MNSQHNNQENEWNPPLSELLKALEDRDHPRHEEAVRLNQEISKDLRPALERLRTIWSDPMSKMFKDVRVNSLNQPKILHEPLPSLHEHTFPVDNTLQESMKEHQEQQAKIKTEKIQREKDTLCALETLAGAATVMNDRMHSIEQNQELEASYSARSHRQTLILGIVTLLVALVGAGSAVIQLLMSTN